MTSNWIQRSRNETYSTCGVPSTACPKFSSISLYDQPLDIAHFMIFPLTPMLKFQSAVIFFSFLADVFHSLMITLFIIKFKVDKNCRSSVFKSPVPYGTVLIKKIKVPYFFNFGRSPISYNIIFICSFIYLFTNIFILGRPVTVITLAPRWKYIKSWHMYKILFQRKLLKTFCT